MKVLYWTFGIVLAAVATLACLQYLASERVEVVELHTMDDAGDEQITRLWVVDYQQFAYLRSGNPKAGWYTRATKQGKVTVVRQDESKTYEVVPEPAVRDQINQLMSEKYTWGDDFISFFIKREEAIPVKLVPTK